MPCAPSTSSRRALAEAGVSVPEGAVELPEDAESYTSFDTDGTTRTKEYCSFNGEVDIDGAPHAWVGGALLRLLHGQRLGQLGRHRPHHLHICKLLEFPLRGSDGNAILGKLSIKRGRKLSTWFGAFQGC